MLIQGNLVGFFMLIANGAVVVIGAFVLKLPNPVMFQSVNQPNKLFTNLKTQFQRIPIQLNILSQKVETFYRKNSR